MESRAANILENIVVELTPVGRGAVAVVLAAGPDVTQFVEANFRSASGQSIAKAPIDRILFGCWGEHPGEELIVCRRATDRVEIQCHGGIAAVAQVIGRLAQQGCRHRTWQEWLRQGALDPICAEAQIALASAVTTRTSAILLDQFNGALASSIRAAMSTVDTEDWAVAHGRIDEILAYRDVGLHLTTPWRVVLAGSPNVGKSCLINALAGFERAIVSPIPGTTRDVVTTLTAIEGWPVELADTAGLRPTHDPLETAGIALASAAASQADLVLMVRDASNCESTSTFEDDTFSRVGARIDVWNKCDLVTECSTGARNRASDSTTGNMEVATSALTGFGIADLIHAIASSLVPKAPSPGAAVPFTRDQIDRLTRAREAVARRDAAGARRWMLSLLASS